MSLDLAAVEATELLRTALLAKLAVDLEDPVLARRAARQSLAHARLLSGLEFPPHVDTDEGGARMPELDDLLTRRYPAATDKTKEVPA